MSHIDMSRPRMRPAERKRDNKPSARSLPLSRPQKISALTLRVSHAPPRKASYSQFLPGAGQHALSPNFLPTGAGCYWDMTQRLQAIQRLGGWVNALVIAAVVLALAGSVCCQAF